MQKQTIQSISPVSESTSGAMPVERYSVRQRLLSASLSLAMTGSVGVSSALANAPAINANLAPSSNSFAHATVSHSLSSALNSAAVTHNAAAVSLNLHSATSGLHPLSGFVPGAHSMTGFNRSSLVTPGVLRSVVQNAASQANGGQDLNLASAAPIFRAGGLAGLHQITLLIGGKEQVFSTDSKFTAAELVAAQQVMSGSKQTITINGQGVATGGSFDLSGSTLSALDKAVGGNLNSLVISHGVNVVDSLSSLNLSGSLVNMGSIVLGADAGAKGQLVDSINAANIYNGYGGVIASSTALSALSPTGIALAASNTFFNSGVVNSSSTLNVSAPTIVNAAPAAASGIVHAGTLSAKQDVTLTTQNLTNTGLITSSTGNVTINNGGGDNNIVVNGAGGTVQATNGNISFNQAGYAGSGNLSVNGGDYLSKQVNFNAGTGAIDANVGEITGEVNGTAGSSHVIAATNNLNLGTICVSGDPTYYNTAGDITISGALTGDPDLALIASGNIIGNGGSLDTSAATVSKTIAGTVNGGNILLVAGAHFTGVTGSIVTPPGDTSSTITLDGTASPTGGYIDLSGTVFTGSSTNKSVTAITSSGGTTGNGGNITMVAFQGTAKNSGGLIGSSNGGSVLVDASGKAGGTGGNVTMIGSGQFVFATEVVGASLTALGGKASVTAPIDVTKGAATGGTFIVAPGSETNTTVQFGSIFTSGAVNIDTAGLVNLAGVTHAGSANITSTKGFVEASILNTAGAGGVTNLTTMNGGAGGDGGNITVHAATGMFFNIVDASGAGGAGGGSTASLTGNGGAGGKGGNVDLEASGGSIQVAYYLNASGGGGGGGAGANEQVGVGVGTAGSGGAAGGAGQVVIKASGSYFAGQPIGYSVLDFDGAAGGKGGAAAGVAGGGGGGGTSFGGGGGGGAAGIGVSGAVGGGGAGTYVVGSGGGGAGSDLNNTATQLLGGGGGSAVATNGSTNQFSSSNLFGTAGTAGAGAGTGSGAKNGAAGSISYFNSSGNLVFGVTGGNAGGYVPPVSPSTVPALGGAGGALDAPGTGGASGLTSPTNFGSTGGNTTTEFGAGSVNLTVGAATGSAKAPVVIDTPTLTLTGTTKAASIYDASGGQSVNLLSANMFSGSTLSIIESHNILTVSGPITGASTVLLDGWGGVTVKGAITADKLVSIVAGQTPFSSAPSGIGGDITGSALITAPTVNLTALRGVSADGTKLGLVGGNITANTTATTISANGQGSIVATAATPGVNLTINPTAGKTTTISTGSSGSAFNLNILGGQTVVDSKVITASNMTITTSGAVGTAAKPFLTNVGGTLTVNGSSLAPVYLKDSGLVSLILAGSGAAGESINLVSAAKTLTLNSLGYGDVTISDTYATAGKSAQVLIAAGANVGNGFGVVSISAAAADINEGVAAGIAGTDVILSSKAGNIGATGTINVATPLLSANAAKGKVDITDSVAVTLSAGTALSSYDVSAYGITVNGAINGGTIALNGTGAGPVVLDANVGGTKSTSVAITSGAGITQNAKAVISGLAIVLDGGAGDIGTLTQSVFTKATNTLAINDGTGRTANVNQNGKALLIASAAGGASTLNLVDASALIVDGVVSYGATNITAPSVTVDKTGLIAGASATIIAPVVSIDTGSGVAGISLTGSAIFLSSTTLTINGDGSITPGTQLVLGGKVNGKSTTAITLGDAKTGNGNPLDASFKGVNVTSLTINTTGNFTSAETGITVATDTFGNGGTIDLTAKNIVIAGSSQAPYPPFMLNANGAAGKDGGYINFNLTGTQNVTVGNGAGSAKTGPNYEFIVNGGVNGNAGSISVASGGVLSVSSVGINLVTSAGGGSLTLSGAKGLAVLDDVFNGGNSYSLVSLTSGATTAFTIGTPTTINGVSSSINAFNVSITASGPIVVNGSGPQIIASADTAILNPTGALVITGPGSITPGSSLALTGKSGVTLGDAKTGLGNPLSNIGLNSLDSLLVNAGKGNFTSPINSFTLANGGTGGVLSITAANMVVSGGGAKQISLTAGSANGNAGSVTLNLTGTQALTLDANQGTLKAPTYVISNIGGGTGGAITVQSGGALIDNLNGVLLNAGSNLTLNGVKSLAVNDSVLVSSGNINSLTLVSGATGAFVVGVAPSANGVNAGVNGINAGTVSITDGAGIIVNNNIQATNANADVVFNTKAFTNNATIQANSGNTTISFGVAGLSGASNGIVFNASSGSFFGGFSNTIINATGAVKLGPLFSGPTAYLSGINFLSISTPGAVTVNANGSGTPTIDIGAGATLQIYAGSLVSAASAPITITPTTNTALITIDTKAALTIGTAKGNIALPTGLASANLTSNGGVLTVNTAINASNVSLVGTSVTVAQSVNASGNLSVAATSSSGSITTVNSAALNANAIQIGDMNTKLSATPINVSAVTVSVGGLVVPGLAPMTGALSINNTYSAAPTSLIGSSLAALNYTGSDDVTVSSLATTKGALTIATTGSITVSPASTLNAVGGNLTLRTTDTLAAHTLSIGNGSQLLTTNGSITIENDGLSNAGAITVGSNVLMHASATAKGVGQVSIVMGAVPAAATLAPGATPAANPPVILSSGGATVTYGTAPGNTSGSITINGAGVVLNAAGRNVVFNTGAGNTSSIVLQGNDTITADPPVGAASSATTSSPSSAAIMPAVFATPAASAFASPSGVSAIALPSISSTNTVSSTVALTGPAFSVAPLSANQSVAPAISNLAAINGSESVSLSSSTASANHKPLNGGVSNTAERSLQKGSMFVAPDVDTVIQTGFGSVNVAAGSVALVVAFDGGVAVYNLHDSKRDSVVVSGNGHNVSVVPGRNAILTTRNVHYFEEVNPAEFVGYRRLTSTAFGDGVKAFQSEFDIRTMLMGVEPLKQLVRAEDAHSRKVSGSLLKTAAILMTISDTTPYERMVAPRMTAMNQ